MRKELLVVALVSACLGAEAAHGEAVEERRPVDADVVVTVKNINGAVDVEGWDKKELEVTGTITGDVEKVEVGGSPSRMRVEVRFPENMRRTSGSADLRIRMPVGGSVRVHVVNADITIGKVTGDVDVEAVNGDITVAGKPEQVTVKTVNGTIGIQAQSARIEAESVGGRITIEGAEGDVSAASVGGDIDIAGGRVSRARFTSVSGTVEFAAALAANASLDADGHSGDVILHLPADVSAEFDINTFSGDIENAFGPGPRKRGYGPGQDLSFSTGDGGAQVTINTFSGDVRLVKK